MTKRQFDWATVAVLIPVFTFLAWYGRSNDWLGRPWLWYATLVCVGGILKIALLDPIKKKLKD
jgi:hypothetical protein